MTTDMGPRRQSIRFAEYELDPANRVLRRNGSVVKLPPQPFKVLTLLASRPNELVTREELRQAIWGDEVVVDFEHGLNTCIRQIRTALGEEAGRARIIETVARLGYRFKAKVNRERIVAIRRWSVATAFLGLLAAAAYLVGTQIVDVIRTRTTRNDQSHDVVTSSGVSRVSLPRATVGVPYSFTLRMYPSVAVARLNDGVPTQVTGWAALGLPPGLEVDFSGYISGNPTAAGTYSPTFILMHRSWNDTNGNLVPDCDLASIVPNAECGATSSPNPLRMTYSLTVDPVAITRSGALPQ